MNAINFSFSNPTKPVLVKGDLVIRYLVYTYELQFHMTDYVSIGPEHHIVHIDIQQIYYIITFLNIVS